MSWFTYTVNSQCSKIRRIHCKRLNFREDLIFANFANRLRFAKNRSREQFGQYDNTTEVRFDSRKLEPANNFKSRLAKI
ncbi:MAG: hypothetical protein PV344_05330 [Anaplasma sp.]|nr:hypothetical protein [Anaplasma sp.]